MTWEIDVLKSLGWDDNRIEAIQNAPVRLTNPHRNLPFWHKGQTHCHSNQSPDGHDGPWGFEGAYQQLGYSFVCLTDHNRATRDPNRAGIVHIDSGEDGYRHRHHMCVLGINWGKVIWYHDNVDPHRDSNQNGLDDRDTCPCENIQPRIDYVTQIQGSIAVLAHPKSGHSADWHPVDCDEGWSLNDLKRSRNYTGIEILSKDVWSIDWWDEVLKSGKQVWGFAADDSHDKHSNWFSRGWIVVNSALDRSYIDTPQEDELRQDILQNIRDGNFVAVVRCPMIQGEPPREGTSESGPQISIGVVGNAVVVQMDQVGDIYFVVGTATETRKSLCEYVDRAVYELVGDEIFVRVEGWQTRADGEQYCTFSQPMFVV